MWHSVTSIYYFYSLAVEAGFYGNAGRMVGSFTTLRVGDGDRG